MISYFYVAYYSIKDFFSSFFLSKNTFYTINYKINDDDEKKITEMEMEIKNCYNKIDLDSIYDDITILNNLITRKTDIVKILDYLQYEKLYIEFHNGNNIKEFNVDDIQKNTYITNLYDKFTLLEDIRKKEKELEIFKQSLY